MREVPPHLVDAARTHPTHGRFEPARLTQARVRAGLSKTDLAGLVGVSAAAIGQYEAGVNSPRVEVVEGLARCLRVRPGFFAVGRPLAGIDTVNTHFRSVRSARVRDRQKALAIAAQLWELTFTLERFVRLPAPDLPLSLEHSAPAEAAAALRRHWSLPDGPVKHLVATAESRGIVVSMRPAGEIDSVDAFSATIVERPIIFTTPRRSASVFPHRFSVAHELGHLVLHHDRDEQSSALEQEADEFAAAFLTPAAWMDEALPSRLDLVALDRLGRVWGVSVHSLIRRMVERGRTTESSARRAYRRLAAAQGPVTDPTSAYPGEVPTLLQKAIELAAEHGGPIGVLADHLQITPPEIRSLVGAPDARPTLRLVTEND